MKEAGLTGREHFAEGGSVVQPIHYPDFSGFDERPGQIIPYYYEGEFVWGKTERITFWIQTCTLFLFVTLYLVDKFIWRPRHQ